MIRARVSVEAVMIAAIEHSVYVQALVVIGTRLSEKRSRLLSHTCNTMIRTSFVRFEKATVCPPAKRHLNGGQTVAQDFMLTGPPTCRQKGTVNF